MNKVKYKMPDGARQVRYNCMTADYAGIKVHPETQMRKLGFKLIAAVPQSLCDEWWFTVEDNSIELPEYIREADYDFGYWHVNGGGIYLDHLGVCQI